jgi:hypothetical protein
MAVKVEFRFRPEEMSESHRIALNRLRDALPLKKGRGIVGWILFDESPNLYVIYTDEVKRGRAVQYLAIPKRSLNSSESLCEFGRLLSARVHTRISAFPVISVAPVAPIPVVPMKENGDGTRLN